MAKAKGKPKLYKKKKGLKDKLSPILIVSIGGLIIIIGSVVASSFSYYFSQPTDEEQMSEVQEDEPIFQDKLIRARLMSLDEIAELNSEGKIVLRALDFPTSPSSKEIYNLNLETVVIERINYNDECFGSIRSEFASICPTDATELPIYMVHRATGELDVYSGYKSIPELRELLV